LSAQLNGASSTPKYNVCDVPNWFTICNVNVEVESTVVSGNWYEASVNMTTPTPVWAETPAAEASIINRYRNFFI
jgi:hypothetical protein